MLKIESQDVVNQTAYWEDDANPLQYYALPGEPTMAVRNGKPVFMFTKYRRAVPRTDGSVGGGLLVMQAELAIPPEDEAEIRRRIGERLRARGIPAAQAGNVQLGRPMITRGKVTVAVSGEGSDMVQKVVVPSPPSLFGNNAVSISVELNQEGAALFEQIFKGDNAGAVTVGYELGFSGKLPKAHIVGSWEPRPSPRSGRRSTRTGITSPRIPMRRRSATTCRKATRRRSSG
jgi:hypothetical protein